MFMKNAEVSALLHAIDAGKLNFSDVISFIDDHYRYTPVEFHNGEAHNPAGVNEGSAKVFGFAQLHGLNQADTLKLFCEHYQAVKNTPNGNDHTNIRNFLFWGWRAFLMPRNPLSPRQAVLST